MVHPLHKHRQGAARAGPATGRRRPRPAHRPAYLQARLAVSRPTEPAEREADQVAGQIARSPRPLQRASLAPGAGPQDEGRSRLLPKRRQTPLLEELREEQSPRLLPRLYRQPTNPGPETGPGPPEPLETETEPVTEETELAPEPASPQAGGGGLALDPEIEQRIEAERGRGAPLPEDVRAEMEASFEHDLAAVRIHTDAQAAALARAVDARAFTVGDDIFFAPGEYAPHTEAGRELLAHELTHVVQHRGGIQTRLYRAKTSNAPAAQAPSAAYHEAQAYIEFPTLPYPKVPKVGKGHFDQFKPLIRHRNYSRSRSTRQNQIWFSQLPLEGAKSKLREAPGFSAQGAGSGQLIFKVPSSFRGIHGNNRREAGNVRYLMGSLDECAREAARPSWTPKGRPALLHGRSVSYEIDHVVEAQVGARSPTGDRYVMKPGLDSMRNYVLLRGHKNQAKGEAVTKSVERQLSRFLSRNTQPYHGKPFKEWSARTLKHRLSLQFNDVSIQERLEGLSIGADDVWSGTEMARGDHIQALLNTRQIRCIALSDLDRRVPDGHMWIFHRRTGGLRTDLRKSSPTRRILKPFRLQQSVFQDLEHPAPDATLATLHFILPRGTRSKLKPFADPVAINIKSLGGSSKLGYYEDGRIQAILGLRKAATRQNEPDTSTEGQLILDGLSPIQVASVDVTRQGLHITGQIAPNLSIFNEAFIDFEVLGDHLRVSKTFLIGEIKVPEPFAIEACSITVSGGTEGLRVGGAIDFAIQRLGKGQARARYSQRHGIMVDGHFDFDERLFGRGTDARIRFGYRENRWLIGGQISIPRRKVPGIGHATMAVTYSESEGFSATGAAELDIPGVEKGTLSIRRSEEQGFMIGGSFDLSKDIPGIKSGRVSAELTQRPGGERYELKASGEAVPDIPGFDTRLRVAYDNGALTISARAHYRKGLLEGTVTAGATNRSLDEQGQPTGEPGDRLVVFGGGTVTVQLTPWLQGTAGIRFAPNGEVTVSGEIALPSSVELFPRPRKEIKKNIFSIHIDIPIVGVSVLGHHIGIFATVGGGLDAHAGIGPGTIDQLRLGVTYSPAHEEQTAVSGDGRLRVPADAGLRLFVRGGLGAGIPVVSASAGLEVGGELGLQGAAEAGVHIEWMPGRGLDLRATGRIFVQPRFKFDITGYVDVEADLLLKTVELYSKRWKLKQFEYGSNLRFGIVFPIHYVEGQPFDISLSDVRFETPQIHPRRLLADLIRRI